ncbi:fungal-specific transcription factor domain-containing protein [Dichomitus squalens]|uniref:Fungal-specific transcription factor domain-containing protein n=1 Tax=Dichomitus squalens TaxID=114155 RepID=A0A4Q9M7S3_9APHY|nr:fungal-specific transcription factor domain-containing protein [Dichomitus squalens]
MGLPSYGAGVGGKAGDKQVRRRSSKACDQCRKSKCKCERSSPQEPCRNCVMLGTQCTFLGPSRKRGPPKGYIDAIEARLHQTEALIGILLSSKDSRAKGVLEDLAEDPLAKEIINRVDNSPYGYKGRSRGAEAPTSRARPPPPPEQRDGNEGNVVHATHPSNEWQDQVISRLNTAAATRNTLLPDGQVASTSTEGDDTISPPLSALPPSGTSASARKEADSQAASSDGRRQRRRLDGDGAVQPEISRRSTSSASSRSPIRHGAAGEESMEETDESGEDEMAVAVGQLSLNEDEQVRFHGKMSGLHLLGVKERQDGRNEGGLWRFPKARVWPPLPPSARASQRQSEDFAPRLPDLATQELLLELYFTYVHPVLPIVHKRTFMDDFRNGNMSSDSPYSGAESVYSDAASPVSASSPHRLSRRRVPTLLLLAMFSLAARYSSRTAAPPPEDGSMWTAGDEYMEDAKVILDRTYAASRPSTCQALLLLGYREVGIGAMAQAWLYVGMAVRMAQDLGLHKSAEKWTSVGRSLFSRAELQERRRIWYGCVVMDKYVCTYIGRPVAIFERDFDTELPVVEEGEETELWRPHPAPQVFDAEDTERRKREVVPAPGYVLSCFDESAKLSLVLSQICQSIYAIKPAVNRPSELTRLDSQLTKWCLELPESLRFDPASPKNPPPPPHILTLHMQYWCTVLLLHRPFIRHIQDSTKLLSPSASSAREANIQVTSRQHYDMCVQAANHISRIASVYCDAYSPNRASVFLCYYVFTAAIMHVATLRTYPDDPQGQSGLDKCMDILKRMSVIWPSAWRALELLTGAKLQLDRPSELPSLRNVSEPRHKRTASDSVDSEDVTVTDRSRIITQDHAYRQQANYPAISNTSQGHASAPAPSHAQQSYSLSLEMPPSSGSYLQPSYDRWPTDSSSLASFPSSISTSVLPQTYSTGLVDERIGSSLGRSSERQSQRYPQYWNDYSALGQMETNYSVPVTSEIVSQHGGAQPGTSDHHGHQQPMYDQYSMFGELQFRRFMRDISSDKHAQSIGNMPPSNLQ